MTSEMAALRCLIFSLFLLEIVCLSGCAGGVGQTTVSAAAPYNGPISASSTNLDFGNVSVGKTSKLNVTLSNPSQTGVTLTQEAVTGRGFSAAGVGSGLTLGPGQSATLAVSFLPQGAGSDSGSVSISTTNATLPITILLHGNGVQSSGHSVTLRWNPSSSAVGYHVYRKTAGGRFGKVSTGLDRDTTYTDTSVQAGKTYSYGVTAVGHGNAESEFSNEVSVTIPSP